MAGLQSLDHSIGERSLSFMRIRTLLLGFLGIISHWLSPSKPLVLLLMLPLLYIFVVTIG